MDEARARLKYFTNASALQGGDVVAERPALPLPRAVPGFRLLPRGVPLGVRWSRAQPNRGAEQLPRHNSAEPFRSGSG